ncbi:hypothetical protein AE618_03550 [Bosea vaviloviae]|uniref:Uncharacterized protein n=1 Tax=Bosea vaviloviae TaxID=1526658 RepID=A0A0N0MCM9_9HYPH|nr:hypothetical protein AE618_03550 [Bosea vaviloviae]
MEACLDLNIFTVFLAVILTIFQQYEFTILILILAVYIVGRMLKVYNSLLLAVSIVFILIFIAIYIGRLFSVN